MKVRIKKNTGGVIANGGAFPAGRIVEVEDGIGARWVRDGLAERVRPESATFTPPGNAAKPRPRARKKAGK